VVSDCTCLICSGVEPDDESDRDRVQQVRDHGWSVVGVLGTADFAYTVGLQHSFGRPELAMFALVGEDMMHWLNRCVDRALDQGWPGEEEPFTGVLDGAPVQLRTMHPSWDDAFFGTAERFYRRAGTPVQQLVWSDRAGNWPWVDAASPRCRSQPRGWLPVAQHPAGGWRLVAELGRDFPFDAQPDDLALTTLAVRDGRRPIGSVANDSGVFDVLDERGYRADDLCLAHLGALVRQHPELVGCADLPGGQVAVPGPGGGWTRSALPNRLRRRSKRSWRHLPPPPPP
jgi:hypothetical protein